MQHATSLKSGCTCVVSSPRLRHRQNRMPPIGRWRLRHSDFSTLCHEFPKRPRARHSPRPSHSNLRADRSLRDFLVALAKRTRFSHGRQSRRNCSGASSRSRNCLRRLPRPNRPGPISSRIHSHQPSILLRLHQRPSRLPRLAPRRPGPLLAPKKSKPPTLGFKTDSVLLAACEDV